MLETDASRKTQETQNQAAHAPTERLITHERQPEEVLPTLLGGYFRMIDYILMRSKTLLKTAYEDHDQNQTERSSTLTARQVNMFPG